MKTIYITDDRSNAVRELAALLAGKGFKVAVNPVSGEKTPEGCEGIKADLLNYGSLKAVLGGLGGLSGILHPAPPFIGGGIVDIGADLWEKAFMGGPMAAMNVTKAAGEILGQGGALVFLGDLHAEKPTGSGLLHSISCAATQMLCREASLDYGRRGISCHYIQRGVMAEDIGRKNGRSNLYSAPEKQFPVGRLIEAGDLAELTAFLFSGNAGVLNGADLRADNGASMYYGNPLSDDEIKNIGFIPEQAVEFSHKYPGVTSPEGRVALITGGGKGVGAGIARVFCKAGIRVCVGWNSSRELALKTLDEIKSAGGEAFLFKADVTDRAQLEAMAAETVRRYGGIDTLVNNAAMQPNRFIHGYDEETLRRVWDINIGGYLRALQVCLPYLTESEGGRVINVSSIHGKRPAVFDPGYAMTKAAIRLFTREAALELAAGNITVNSIELGTCRIEGKTGGFAFPIRRPGETRENPVDPMGRVCDPEDAGYLALYIASREAENLTGAGIRLDAGAMLV